VSGFEPLTCRLQEALSRAQRILPHEVNRPATCITACQDSYGTIIAACQCVPGSIVASVLSACWAPFGAELCWICVGGARWARHSKRPAN
jgi:hypothetical protein